MHSLEYCLSDNTTLCYVEHGSRDGIPVVMLHGYTDSAFSFSRLLPLLPDDVRAIALTQRGHGDSGRPDGPYTLDRFARDVIEVMDGLHLGPAVIVGHCMGGFIARRVADIAPSRVGGLVVIAGAPTARTGPIPALAGEVLGFKDPVERKFIREFQMSTIERDVPDHFMNRVVDESAKLPARVWKDVLAGLLEADLVPPSPCPTLIVGGDRDSVFSIEDQRALATHIPHSDLLMYEGVGHSPQWEIPDQLASDLVTFIPRSNSVSARTSA